MARIEKNRKNCESKGTLHEPDEERKKLYSETRKDLLTRQLSNSESYDKAILSLSSALLGFSLVFIKDIFQIERTAKKIFLYWSWYLFAAAIILTIVSFVISNFGIKKQLKYARKYYLEGQEEYLNKRNIFAMFTDYVNILSGVSFILAIVFTICFVTSNLGV